MFFHKFKDDNKGILKYVHKILINLQPFFFSFLFDAI